MIAMRRLRAVLLFAMLSAIGWAIVGTLIVVGVKIVARSQLAPQALFNGMKVLAAFGFAAGTTWAITLAVLPRRADQSVTAPSAALAGALGGLLVLIGTMIATGSFSVPMLWINLIALSVAAAIGATVGLSIQRVAARGQLPAPDASAKGIEG